MWEHDLEPCLPLTGTKESKKILSVQTQATMARCLQRKAPHLECVLCAISHFNAWKNVTTYAKQLTWWKLSEINHIFCNFVRVNQVSVTYFITIPPSPCLGKVKMSLGHILLCILGQCSALDTFQVFLEKQISIFGPQQPYKWARMALSYALTCLCDIAH